MFASLFTVLTLSATGFPSLEVRTARDLRSLPADRVATGWPVRLTGVVTFAPNPARHFYLQDGTGGVRVEWPSADRKLKVGTVVEVSGTTTTGRFLTEVKARDVKPGHPIPEAPVKPQAFNLTTEEAYYLDAQWVVAEAVVQRVWVHGEWLKLDLARGRGQTVAYVPQPLGHARQQATDLRGAAVRVRGVWQRTDEPSNPSRLLISDICEFETLRPAAPVQSLPLVTATELNPKRSRPDPIGARLPVRVSGIVTLNQAGRQLYVHDETGVVHVILTDAAVVATGQRVTAVGFPRAAGTTDPPRVENAWLISRDPVDPPETDTLPLPPAVPGHAADAAAGKQEGRVVRFAGVVHAVAKSDRWLTLTVLVDDLTFTAFMLGPIPDVEVGSRVEVVGVATRQQFDKLPRHTFAVLTRAKDFRVLEGPPRPPEPSPPPSWWTGPRVAYLTAGFCGLFLLSGATVTALRVQVRRAAALARRQSERNQKLEGQLQVASKFEAVGRVAGGVAHDFNNILTVINGCAQLLDEEIASDPRHAATLAADIRRAGRLAAAITRLLLTFSRHRAIAPHPLDVNATIADAAPILARLVGARTALRVNLDPSLPPVIAETGLLLQILINLTVNAGEAMPDGGSFTLATSAAEPGWVLLTATDTGSGMTKEVMTRAFERGFTTKASGTGTGLSTVFDIVQTLGGRLQLGSDVGRGTTFQIELPAASAPLLAPPPAPVEAVSPVPREPSAPAPVVLVVEDDEAVGAFVRHVLEHDGCSVLSLTDPEQALRVVADGARKVDLLITDVTLPGIGGRQLADRVQAARPGVRVLFISGYTSDEVDGAGDAPANFLHKPFGAHDLTERVWRLLGRPG